MAYTTSISQMFRDDVAETPTDLRNLLLTEVALPGKLDNATNIQRQLCVQVPLTENVEGDARLRNSVAAAIENFVVVSGRDANLARGPYTIAVADILRANAFGTVEDIIKAILTNPAFVIYLTALGNLPADGTRSPDENLAREVLQLFGCGLVELDTNGNPILDSNGREILTYGPSDIAGLAAVLTGINLSGRSPLDPTDDFGDLDADGDIERFDKSWYDLVYVPSEHEWGDKTFLGHTIEAVTDPAEQTAARVEAEILEAAEVIAALVTTTRYWAMNLIKLFVASNPPESLTSLVIAAGEQGQFRLPDNSLVGSGNNGCLEAMVAAIYTSDELRNGSTGEEFGGRVRTPAEMIRNALAYTLDETRAAGMSKLRNNTFNSLWQFQGTGGSFVDTVGGLAYSHQSVFGAQRPGYTPPGTVIASDGKIAPELQQYNESAISGINLYMQRIADRDNAVADPPTFYSQDANWVNGIQPFDHSRLIAFLDANDASALIDKLDVEMTGGRLTTQTKEELLAFANRDSRTTSEHIVTSLIGVILSCDDYWIQE